MGRKKYKDRRAAAFIFDLDGTLIDSGRDIALAANFARGHFRLPPLPLPTVIAYVGDGVHKLLERVLGHEGDIPDEETVAEGLTIFRDHYGRHCLDNTTLYPGVLNTVARYRQMPLMVATNKPRRFTDQILQGLHLADAFRFIATPENGLARKPAPDQLLACLEGLDVSAPEVVVVGDHPNDVEAARAIGAVAVGVTYGLTAPGLIRSAGADLLIDGFAELADLFPSR